MFSAFIRTELYCYAAYEASVRLSLPFSSYFHNTYLDNAAINSRRATDIQARIFERSEHVFVMSEGMKRFYDEKYGQGKFVPLLHTFEEYPTFGMRYQYLVSSKERQNALGTVWQLQ